MGEVTDTCFDNSGGNDMENGIINHMENELPP